LLTLKKNYPPATQRTNYLKYDQGQDSGTEPSLYKSGFLLLMNLIKAPDNFLVQISKAIKAKTTLSGKKKGKEKERENLSLIMTCK
jgi:hypothetical protein